MYGNRDIKNTLADLEELQQAGLTLAEATESLHSKDNIPFDDIWPAIMKIQQVSEREAMQLTKKWCGLRKDGK